MKANAKLVDNSLQSTPIPKRVVLTKGGKGGVGKTSFMLFLAEWFEHQGVPFTLLDLDTENKQRGSLKHYFEGRAEKVDIHTPAGLDAFFDYLDHGAPVVLADMGAGAGKVTYDWFETMHESAKDLGISFTAVGVVTPDPASVESVLTWAKHLQSRVDYLIVENEISYQDPLTYWRFSEQADRFRQIFHPSIVQMKFRLPSLENPARQHGVSIGQVALRQTRAPELQQASLVARAKAYREHMFAQLDPVREFLLP